MSRNDSSHRKISAGRHFQNGHHNTEQIQHCSILTSWIDSPKSKNSYRSKSVKITTPETWPGIHLFKISFLTIAKSVKTRYGYNLTIMESPKLATDNGFKKLIKSYLWNRTMLNFCGIVVANLKMETGSYFSISGKKMNSTSCYKSCSFVWFCKVKEGRTHILKWWIWSHL
jgi:hypothetical protein